MEKIKVVNLAKWGLPKYETSGSVGMDLRAWVEGEKTKPVSESFVQSRDGDTLSVYLRPMGRAMIDTGLCIQLPEGMEAQIRNRSGLTARNGIVAQLGTIDSDYRGHLIITVINYGTETFKIDDGDRIAQLVFNRIEKVELEAVNKLDTTERGEGGIGHTGKE